MARRIAACTNSSAILRPTKWYEVTLLSCLDANSSGLAIQDLTPLVSGKSGTGNHY
mgnify:CR=1 FL=1|jgi:hypothetical protein